LSAAATALDQALAGDDSAWEAAEATYGRAARGALLDSYPLWVLELIRGWRAPNVTPPPGTLGGFLTAVRARAYDEADALAATLETPRAKELADRLVNDLRSAGLKREAAPTNSR